MLRQELIRSCSNPPVADVVLRSLGCDFHSRFREFARVEGTEPGRHAAEMVKSFADTAGASDWRRLEAVMSGEDMPLLSGFRFILEDMIDRAAFPVCGPALNQALIREARAAV